MPTPALLRMAESVTPTTSAVARAILDAREAVGPPRDQIFTS
ncbi:hypothetical protein [Amycolatopsis sp. NPDC049159]